MKRHTDTKSPVGTPATSGTEPTFTERVLTRFKNTKIVAYAILIGTVLIGLSKLVESTSKLLTAIPLDQTISSYDARTEESLFEVAKLIDDFLSRLIDSQPNQMSFDSCHEDYRKIEVELRQLQLRNNVRPLNSISTQMVGLLMKMWGDVKDLHQKERYLNPTFVQEKQRQLTEAFTQILELEKAKPK
jgi:hypothetical protein